MTLSTTSSPKVVPSPRRPCGRCVSWFDHFGPGHGSPSHSSMPEQLQHLLQKLLDLLADPRLIALAVARHVQNTDLVLREPGGHVRRLEQRGWINREARLAVPLTRAEGRV